MIDRPDPQEASELYEEFIQLQSRMESLLSEAEKTYRQENPYLSELAIDIRQNLSQVENDFSSLTESILDDDSLDPE